MHEEMGNFNKVVEMRKKNHMEMLEMKKHNIKKQIQYMTQQQRKLSI